MGFAQPLALLFLGLFIPVILLYLLKQRRRRIEVSTLLFWDKILRDEQSVTSLTRLWKLLSLLLQLAFIALLSFAIARPLLSGKWTGARRILLFLDTSASMQVVENGRTRFDAAMEKARAVIRGMSIGDTLMLISVSSTPDIAYVFSDNRKDLAEALGKIEATHGEADFKKALALLDQLPGDDRETHVYLITDGAFAPVDVPNRAKTQYAFLKVGEAKENVGITSFQVRPLPSSPLDFEILLEITNETEQDQTFPVELRIGGGLADAFEFKVPAASTMTRNLRQYSAQGGEIEVFADFKDAFPLDNRAFAVLPPPRPVRVALVTESDLFLERALATDDGVSLTTVLPKEYPPTNKVDVTVFSGWHPEKRPEGSSIFILNWPAEGGPVRKGTIEKPLFTEWDRSHPINRHLALQNISIEKAVAIEKSEKYTALSSSFGEPLVLLSEEEQRKTMWVAFDPNSSDLPLRVAFPIMIANAVRFLSEANTNERWGTMPMGSILTGLELKDNLAAHQEMTNTVSEIVGPDAKVFRLESDNALVALNRAGIYRAKLNDQATLPILAANLNSKTESRIKPSDQLPLKSSQPLPEIKEGLRLGFEPWFALVAIGLLLSAVEWGLFHRRVVE